MLRTKEFNMASETLTAPVKKLVDFCSANI
jgi:hypothetical protein